MLYDSGVPVGAPRCHITSTGWRFRAQVDAAHPLRYAARGGFGRLTLHRDIRKGLSVRRLPRLPDSSGPRLRTRTGSVIHDSRALPLARRSRATGASAGGRTHLGNRCVGDARAGLSRWWLGLSGEG
jgi:hypothetical protein